MTTDDRKPGTGRKRNRFVIQDDEIEITGGVSHQQKNAMRQTGFSTGS